ncbi:type II secretion system minor pseudopilin GspK [Sphingomonas sp. Leaf20]|uniref:type II secretion system minor pseudopilin GspK n=1 Tax=Sphingomonas sp. Leaf20 TaxID=1735685 RepID=UPI00191049EA|nr:type II secretion system minor pseudopilin GspK [Sphingomonas sp. Leaf20]
MRRRDVAIPARERGAALLTVLMLVAIIAVMAGAALEKLRLSTRLAGNAAAGEQARAYALAAETLATTRIGAMLEASPKRVTLQGDWSGRPFGMPLPGGGFATARVRDGGNCFNLNSLVSGRAGAYVTDPLMRPQFVRLMRLLDVPVQVAEQIAAGTADWIDSDQAQQAMGAEDAAYLNRETPYRTADTLMTDPSEIRAVAGMTPQIYATLKPWICTLPIAQAAPINVNTLLPEQAPILAMLFPDTMSIAGARQMILQRPPQGVGSTDVFFKSAALQGNANADGERGTAIVSKWFTLQIDVTIGTTVLQEHALIDATTLPARLVSRQWGEDS